jgi:hypothetical protein
MNKSELSELKKLYTQKKCSVQRIAGCFVDGDKNKKSTFNRSFLGIPEEEMFKYFEIFRKPLSGNPGKTCIDLTFPLEETTEDSPQGFLLKLRSSELKDEALLDEYYNKIISSFEFVGSYLIMVVHDVYDVPGKTTDGLEVEDASTEIYDYIYTVLCPVTLSEPGLAWDEETGSFHNRVRDWVVELPIKAFLYPSFNDRSGDISSLTYYSKDSENLGEEMLDLLFGVSTPLSAGGQKETFQALVEETLGETCEFEAIKNIHEKMAELIEEHKEELEPLVLDKTEVKNLFANSGVKNEKMVEFDEHYEKAAGTDTPIYMSNVFNTRSFDVKTPDVTIKVKPDRTDLIGERTVDDRPCLVIELNGDVEVNGIAVRSGAAPAESSDVEF